MDKYCHPWVGLGISLASCSPGIQPANSTSASPGLPQSWRFIHGTRVLRTSPYRLPPNVAFGHLVA